MCLVCGVSVCAAKLHILSISLSTEERELGKDRSGMFRGRGMCGGSKTGQLQSGGRGDYDRD